MAPFRFGLVGLGGYAGSLCNVLQQHFALTSVCEPDQRTHAAKIEQLRSSGVAYFSDYDEFLASDIDGVVLPLPIHLHRPYTERACAAGKHVLCEKPAAGHVDDVDAMIAARDRAGVKVAIGFQHIYDDVVVARKREILRSGSRPTQATVLACWPRDAAYYARNDWAGRIKRDGVWVLDSPANNALAHYINLSLFLLGPDERTSATPMSVQAELYRANAIENYDTCAMRVRTDSNAELMIYLTHACGETINPQVSLIDLGAGTATRADPRVAMFHKFANWCRGADEIVATLEMARAHSLVVTLASERTPIHDVPREHVQVVQHENSSITTIVGIEQVFRECAEKRVLPSEIGLPWVKAGSAPLPGREGLGEG